jgi:hypothetical protein
LAALDGIEPAHAQTATQLARDHDTPRSDSLTLYGQTMKAGGNLTDQMKPPTTPLPSLKPCS